MTQQRNRKTDRGRSRTTAKHYSRDDIIYLAGSEDLHDREIRSQNNKNNKKNTNCITTFKKAYTYGIVDSDKFISSTIKMFLVYGVWRSLVARTAGGR